MIWNDLAKVKPKVGQNCIVACPDVMPFTLHWMGKAFGSWNNGHEQVFCGNDDITYWMALPDSPVSA